MTLRKPYYLDTADGIFKPFDLLDWAQSLTPFRFAIHTGEGSTTVVSTGTKKTTSFIVPFKCTLIYWKLLTDEISTVTVDILNRFEEMGASPGNRICIGSGQPGITAGKYGSGTTDLFDNPNLEEGDIITLEVIANDNAKFIQLLLYYTPTL